jgi:hypothetical protein
MVLHCKTRSMQAFRIFCTRCIEHRHLGGGPTETDVVSAMRKALYEWATMRAGPAPSPWRTLKYRLSSCSFPLRLMTRRTSAFCYDPHSLLGTVGALLYAVPWVLIWCPFQIGSMRELSAFRRVFWSFLISVDARGLRWSGQQVEIGIKE